MAHTPSTSSRSSSRKRLAKLSRPRLRAAIERKRLFRLLDRFSKQGVVWVAGPPGAGKSTLLASWLNARGRKGPWFAIDAGDNDPASFFLYLALSVAAGRRKALPLLLPEYLGDLAGFTRRFLRAYFERLPEGSVLVLDNFHELDAQSASRDVVRQMIAEVPEHVALVIASRNAPPESFAREVASASLSLIDGEALRFDAGETRALVKAAGVSDAATVKQVQSIADGWAAGIALLLGARRTLADASAAGYPQRHLFAYFAAAPFDALPMAAQGVLLRAAALSRIPRAVAEAAFGADALQVLETLYRDNYFVQRRGLDDPAYEFHPLFREFLLDRAARMLSLEERAANGLALGHLLVERGEIEDAAGVYTACGQWSALAGLIAGRAPGLLMEGRWQTLQGWITGMPDEWQDRVPWLAFWLGNCQGALNPGLARHALQRSHRGFVAAQDPLGQALAVAGIVETHFIEWASFAALDPWIDELGRLVGSGMRFPDASAELRVLSSLMIGLLYRGGHAALLEATTRRAFELIELPGNPNHKLMALIVIYNYRIWQGDLPAMERAAAKVAQLMAMPELAPVNRVWGENVRSFNAGFLGTLEDARSAYRRGRQLVDEYGFSFMKVNSVCFAAVGLLNLGDTEGARALFADIAGSLGVGHGTDASSHLIVRAMLAGMDGQRDLAIKLLGDERKLGEKTKIAGPARAYSHLMSAQILAGVGDVAQARELNLAARMHMAEFVSPILEYSSLIVDATCALAVGDESAAIEHLGAGLSIAAQNRVPLEPPCALPVTMARLCALALTHGIETVFVRDLIRLRRYRPPSDDVPDWPWPLRIRALGDFAVLREGVPIAFPRKVPGKPLALLKLLIAWGGKPVPQSEICDELWPDADSAQDALAVTVHRLRKLLGDSDILKLQDGRIALDATRCQVDAWVFESLLARADQADRKGDAIASSRYRDEGIRFYEGPLLPGEDRLPAVLSYRTRLRDRFVQCIGRFAVQCEKERRWDDAVTWYQRGVEADDLEELFYQGIMRCHLAQDRRGAGITLYQRLKKHLLAALGVPPSAQTTALYDKLRGA